MASYNKKKRSLIAGLISFVGSIVMVWGLYLILSEIFTIVTTDFGGAGRIILGVLILILSAAIQYGAFAFDKYRAHRKWVKRLYNAGLVDEMKTSKELAWRAYLSNPTPMGLKFVEEQNPKVAAEIRRQEQVRDVSAVDHFMSSVLEKQPKRKPVYTASQPAAQPAVQKAPAAKPAVPATKAPAAKPVAPAQKTPAAKPAAPAPVAPVSEETQYVRKIPSLAKDKQPEKKESKDFVAVALAALTAAAAAVSGFGKTVLEKIKIGIAYIAKFGKELFGKAKVLFKSLKTKVSDFIEMARTTEVSFKKKKDNDDDTVTK